MTDGPHDDAMMMMDTVLRHLHNRTNAHSSAHGEFVIEGTVSQFPLLPPLSPITPVSPTPQFIPFTPVSLAWSPFLCCPNLPCPEPSTCCHHPSLPQELQAQAVHHDEVAATAKSQQASQQAAQLQVRGPRTIYPGTTFLCVVLSSSVALTGPALALKSASF